MLLNSIYHPVRGEMRRGIFVPSRDEAGNVLRSSSVKVSITFADGETVDDLTPDRLAKGLAAYAAEHPESPSTEGLTMGKITPWSNDASSGAYVLLRPAPTEF